MPANVETMMYVREKPWHGLGTMVAEAPTSPDAQRLAGLDWNVRQEEVRDLRGKAIPGYRANVRESDESVLGIVGERYKVVQNADAFRFTDELIGGDVRYETAGSLREGRQIWLLAKMPAEKLAGDEVEPYLCFTNSHDGGGAVRVCMTPVRVVCNNTLNLALQTATRAWAMRHTESVEAKLNEARNCLLHARKYMDGLSEYADAAARKKISDGDLRDILKEMFPLPEKPKERDEKRVKEATNAYYGLLLYAGHRPVPGYGMGSHQCHERFCLPQYAPPEHEKLCRKQLEPHYGRTSHDGQNDGTVHGAVNEERRR